jgi:hypothetical protein
MSDWVMLDVDPELWERVFVVSPLVLVGTREPDGSFDLAPKHRIVTLPGHFGFVCRPSHATWRNAVRERAVYGQLAESPTEYVMASAAASPRCDDGEKKALRALPMSPPRPSRACCSTAVGSISSAASNA